MFLNILRKTLVPESPFYKYSYIGLQLQSILTEKVAPALVFSTQLNKIFINNFFSTYFTLKQSIVTENMDLISVENLIAELFMWNFDKIFVFQAVTAGYTKFYHSEKLRNAVNNTPATEICRLLTCQNCNCQMLCRPYHWCKQHANISPLILITDWLMAIHCSQKTTSHFLSVFNDPKFILSARSYVCGIFSNSHKYFQKIFLIRIRDVTE